MPTTQSTPTSPKNTSKATKATTMLPLWALSGEIGLKIAIPVILGVLVGIKIDKTFGTTPLFIIFGMSIAFIVSAVLIARFIHTINRLAAPPKSKRKRQ